ncbi:MAG: nucleotide pyrophosphohydrolase [Rhizobacter sp.]|nr:nucleotide pyrophosphohydrolase [Rhizobacter sp.]
MNLTDMQAALRHFAAERDWQPFHTPKNLSTALMVEAAELAEIFQWMTPEQSQQASLDPERKTRIADELADVLLYLLQVADHCEVDLARATAHKLARNAERFPPVRTIPRPSPAHAVAPGVHVLLDYENVQPTEAALRALVPDASQVWVFHGPHQRQVEKHFAGFGDAVTAVPISKVGKNALDFHLSFYVGYIASRNPLATLVVIANDKGYEPMLAHARDLGFAAQQLGHTRAKRAVAAKAPAAKKTVEKKAVAKKAPAKVAPTKASAKTTTPAKKAPAKKVAAKKTTTAAPPPSPAAKKVAPTKKTAATKTKAPPAAKPPASNEAATLKHLSQSLRKMGDARPTKVKSLWRLLKSLLGAEATDDAVEQALTRLTSEGLVRVNSVTGVSYPQFAAPEAEASRGAGRR